ncbi:MAG: hypothetical protein RR957_00215 [Oscillospiraceae bacterium]
MIFLCVKLGDEVCPYAISRCSVATSDIRYNDDDTQGAEWKWDDVGIVPDRLSQIVCITKINVKGNRMRKTNENRDL